MEKTKTVFDGIIAFRALKEDRADLAAVAQKWGLEEAEIARRALRTGLETLRAFKIPGGRERKSK